MAPPSKGTIDSAKERTQRVAPQADRLARQAEQYAPTEAVCIEIPVRVQGSRVVAVVRDITEHTEPFQEEASTLIVFPQGAVVRLSARVAPGQELALTNCRTNQAVSCRVVKVRSYMGGKGYVEIEFAARATGFWGISFPSEASGRPSESGIPPAAASSKPKEPPAGLPPTPPISTALAAEKTAGAAPVAPEESPVADFLLVPAGLLNQASSPATTGQSEKERSSGTTPSANTAPDLDRAEAPIAALPPRDDFGGIRPPSEASSAPRDPIVPAASRDATARGRPRDLTSLADEIAPASASSVRTTLPSSVTDPRQSFESHQRRVASKHARPSSRAGILGTRLGAQSATEPAIHWAQFRRILIFGGLSVCGLVGVWLGARFFLHHQPASAAETSVNPSLVATQTFAPSEGASQTVPAANAVSSKRQSPPGIVAEAQPNSRAPDPAASASAPEQQGTQPADDTSRLLAMPAGKIAAPTARRGKPVVQGEEPQLPALGGEVPSEVPGGQGRNILGGILAGAAQSSSALPPPPTGGRVNPPQLLSSVAPVYPALARKYKVEGDVTIRADIDAAGNVVHMKVVSGPTLLHEAATEALRLWKYEPAKLNDQPVPVQILVTIHFRTQ